MLIGLNCLHYLEHGLYYLFITFVVAWYNHLLCYLHYLQHSVFTFLTVSQHLQHCHECHLHVYLNYLLLPIGLCQQHHHQSAASESSEDALNNEGDALGGHLPQLLAAAAAAEIGSQKDILSHLLKQKTVSACRQCLLTRDTVVSLCINVSE